MPISQGQIPTPQTRLMVDYKIGSKSHNFSFTAYIRELSKMDKKNSGHQIPTNNNNNNNNNIYMHTYTHTCFFFFPKLIFSTLVVASMDLHGVCFLSGI